MVDELVRLTMAWRPAFASRVTWVRAVSVLLGLLVASGRRTLTASLGARHRQDRPWAADYAVFSRSRWEVQNLFDAVTSAAVETCHRLCPGGRRVYGERLPTPDAIRQDPRRPWTETQQFYAGGMRTIRFKEVNRVLWPSGGQRRLLRLIVVAPMPYRAPGHTQRRWYYREPAYLLTTDLDSDAAELIQAYLGRWQIEVEHRDLKTGLGVGQAQVWNDHSVARLHSAHVAMWSMVKLAALRTFGLTRSDAYPPRPRWHPQKPDSRASQADIVAALRAGLQILYRQLPAPSLPPPKKKPRPRKINPTTIAHHPQPHA